VGKSHRLWRPAVRAAARAGHLGGRPHARTRPGQWALCAVDSVASVKRIERCGGVFDSIRDTKLGPAGGTGSSSSDGPVSGSSSPRQQRVTTSFILSSSLARSSAVRGSTLAPTMGFDGVAHDTARISTKLPLLAAGASVGVTSPSSVNSTHRP
jgi:hypothetical protein